MNNNVDTIREYLNNGHSPNDIIYPMLQDTILHSACRDGRPEIVQYILKRGANPDYRNGMNELPIKIAYDNGHENICKIIEKPIILENREQATVSVIKEVIGVVMGNPATSNTVGLYLDGKDAPDDVVESLNIMGYDITKPSSKEGKRHAVVLVAIAITRWISETECKIACGVKVTKTGYDYVVTGKVVFLYGYWIMFKEEQYAPFRGRQIRPR